MEGERDENAGAAAGVSPQSMITRYTLDLLVKNVSRDDPLNEQEVQVLQLVCMWQRWSLDNVFFIHSFIFQ